MVSGCPSAFLREKENDAVCFPSSLKIKLPLHVRESRAVWNGKGKGRVLTSELQEENWLLMQRLLVKSKEHAAGMQWKTRQDISPSSSWSLRMSKQVNLGRHAEGKRPFYSASFFCISVLLVSVYYYREDEKLPALHLNPMLHLPVLQTYQGQLQEASRIKFSKHGEGCSECFDVRLVWQVLAAYINFLFLAFRLLYLFFCSQY